MKSVIIICLILMILTFGTSCTDSVDGRRQIKVTTLDRDTLDKLKECEDKGILDREVRLNIRNVQRDAQRQNNRDNNPVNRAMKFEFSDLLWW